METNKEIEIQAAVFRRMVSHLQNRTDVQNIDLMNLAGFCRNCLSRWYREESHNLGLEIKDESAREMVYGMPYDEWKKKFQTEASKEKLEALKLNES
mgnify:FL=1|tara:strand:+ start:381 stop:671 length:291 start_codon:yes stop_codon:yes gene_type:complete